MPPGDGELLDAGFDGLGLLTDGRLHGRVGWNNDTRGRPVEITFEFDVVREFEAVHIFCDNRFTENVRVFSQVDVLFSVGGRQFSGEPASFVYPEDDVSESPRNVSFLLRRRVGRFIRLRLHFAAPWIAISEVSFDSGTVFTQLYYKQKTDDRRYSVYLRYCRTFSYKFSNYDVQIKINETKYVENCSCTSVIKFLNRLYKEIPN